MTNLNTLFLDRDGVINVKLEGRYVQSQQECIFMPGAIAAIAKLTSVFDRILIVTNQQGIGKGIMTDKDLDILHEFMLNKISIEGGKINKVYYCPHLASLDCSCRKPKPGMIVEAMEDYPEIETEHSVLVGDSDSDIQAGEAMNLTTVKVDNEYTLAVWCEELLSVL